MKRTAYICLLVALAATAGAARAETFRDGATGLLFTDRLAGLSMVGVTDYEKERPGLGVGVGYNGPGITLTIYLYTLGMKSIPESPDSEVFRKHFDQCMGDIITAGQRGLYADVKKLSEDRFSLGSGQAERTGLCGAFSFMQQGTARLSKVYLFVYKNNFLKIRYSYNRDVETRGEATLDRVMKELGAMLH
jgi:hypothetical protein